MPIFYSNYIIYMRHVASSPSTFIYNLFHEEDIHIFIFLSSLKVENTLNISLFSFNVTSPKVPIIFSVTLFPTLALKSLYIITSWFLLYLSSTFGNCYKTLYIPLLTFLWDVHTYHYSMATILFHLKGHCIFDSHYLSTYIPISLLP